MRDLSIDIETPGTGADAHNEKSRGGSRVKGRTFARQWMGRVVRVTAEVKDHKRTEREPILGWVVGYTYRRQGSTGYDDETGTTFVSTGPGTLVYLVCPWPGRATIDAAPDGVELTADIPREAPKEGWSSGWREDLASYVAEFQSRDARGRWVKS